MQKIEKYFRKLEMSELGKMWEPVFWLSTELKVADAKVVLALTSVVISILHKIRLPSTNERQMECQKQIFKKAIEQKSEKNQKKKRQQDDTQHRNCCRIQWE